jgi:hypothetical protein
VPILLLLLSRFQNPHPTDRQSLHQKIEIGAQQLQNEEYTDLQFQYQNIY